VFIILEKNIQNSAKTLGHPAATLTSFAGTIVFMTDSKSMLGKDVLLIFGQINFPVLIICYGPVVFLANSIFHGLEMLIASFSIV
jgi:hypothetical protein